MATLGRFEHAHTRPAAYSGYVVRMRDTSQLPGLPSSRMVAPRSTERGDVVMRRVVATPARRGHRRCHRAHLRTIFRRADGAAGAAELVVIVTDDQRWDTIGRCRNGFDGTDLDAGEDACMPELQRLLIRSGTTFLRAYATTALCCPSWASLLTGDMPAHRRDRQRRLPDFDDGATVATWLDGAGYRTALIGKYLNGYGEAPGAVPDNYVPPGWDSWHAFWGLPGYATYSLVEKDPDGTATTVRIEGTTSSPLTRCGRAATYSTDLLCRRALEFVSGSEDPFFLFFTPFAPHLPARGASATKASSSQSASPGTRTTTPPHRTHPRRSEQPLSGRSLAKIATEFRAALTANRAVDDAIAALHRELAGDGKLDRTVSIFVSDNGLAAGEHRWRTKGCPFEECHRVPMVIACPPSVCPGAVGDRVDSEHFALNIDVAPTIVELSGVSTPGKLDGRSLVPLLGGGAVSWRNWFSWRIGCAGSPRRPDRSDLAREGWPCV